MHYFTVDFIFALRVGLVFGIVAATFPLVYEILRGFHLKNHFARHPNAWFCGFAHAINSLAIYMPLFWGMSFYIILPLALCVSLGLQVIADDYIN